MEQLSASTMKRLAKELNDLVQTPPEGYRVNINEQNLADITADLEGPDGTPFEGGMFRLRLVLPSDFPATPPKGMFLTKVFHPNVGPTGEICVNVLKRDWSSETTLRHVLMVIRCLLIQPFPDSALNEEAGKLLLEDYEEYADRARLMTSIHAPSAAKRPTPSVLTTSGANAAGSGGSGEGGAGKKDGSGSTGAGGGSSPTLKKAKSDAAGGQAGGQGAKVGTAGAVGAGGGATAMSKVKKSLKRL